MSTVIRLRATTVFVLANVAFWLSSTLRAMDVANGEAPNKQESPARPHAKALVAAVRQAIPLLEKGARGSMEQRKNCFTCHNQGVTILALTAAHQRGFSVDREHIQQQVDFIAGFLDKNRERFLAGKGTGGEVATAGYALWTLDAGGYAPGETTNAVAQYLLAFQSDKKHWRMTSDRPPSEHSHFSANYLAIRALNQFGPAEQRDAVAERIREAKQWLVENKPDDTEDHVFRLWALKQAAADKELQKEAATKLLSLQQPDGGWRQKEDLKSDAYATGTALVALWETGQLPTDDAAYQRGLEFLVEQQQADGSWHVASRSKPFQTYFESGFPHGKDQFISITASAWATWAIALACRDEERAGERR